MKELTSIPRSYPFKVQIPGLWFSDCKIMVPATYELPLKVTHTILAPTYFVLVVKDYTGKGVGIFTYLDNPVIELMSDNCSGRLIVEHAELPEHKTKIDQDYIIELHAIKLSSPCPVKSLSVNGTELTGDITLTDAQDGRLDRLPAGNDTDVIKINSLQVINPKCEGPGPIVSINKVMATDVGIIGLESDTPIVTMTKRYDNILEVSSPITNKDFDKHALTGPEGPPGLPGPAGKDGNDAYVAQIPPIVTPVPYGGVLFNGISLATINIDGNYVVGTDSGHIFALGGSRLYDIVNLSYRDFSGATCICLAGSGYLIGTNLGWVRVLDSTSKQLALVAAPTGIVDIAYRSESEYAMLTDDALYLSGGGIHTLQYSINRLRMFNDIYYLLGSAGKFYTYRDGIVVNYDVLEDVELYDIWVPAIGDAYLVGSDGFLGKIDNLGIHAGTLGADDLNAIHSTGGVVMTVGNNGAIYKLKNDRWSKIGSPPIKQWKSVLMLSEDMTYIFGRF